MRAIALTRYLPIADPQSLFDVELPKPAPGERDVLVRVEAISVNPVDTKVRSPKSRVETTPRVLGWDAAGVVESVGAAVKRFKAGDAVYYAGDVTRAGANAEYQVVDEQIVGRKPQNLSFAEAAALPLTTITAWEGLFERLCIDPRGGNRGQSVLIIGGAGGVGSIAIQLAKWAGLVVLATASRPETREWATAMGADRLVDHRQPLLGQITAMGYREVDFIANFNNTDAYWNVMSELIRPLGRMLCIVENAAPIDLNRLKSKSVTFAWEFMFSRAMYRMADMGVQGRILDEVAALVEGKKLRTTLKETWSPITADNLRKAHAQVESGKSVGKLVLAGWGGRG